MANSSRANRRSRTGLEYQLQNSRTDAERARAHFELGLFHDNNGREADAVPHYEAALRYGLSGESQAQCLAWLASSLFKTDRDQEAMERLQQSKEQTSDRELMGFLYRLERRVSGISRGHRIRS